jgi:hypothetical protein
VEVIAIIGISIINLLGFSALNLIVWIVAVGILSYVFYFDDSDKALKRIIECEVLLFYMAVWKSLFPK